MKIFKNCGGKEMKRVILLVVLILVIVAAFTVVIVKSNIEANLEELENSTVSDVDLTKIADGTYTGEYSVFPVAAEVKVTIINHEIKEIELVKHNNGQGKRAEIIPAEVVKAQTLSVDIVTGATYSSKVILKAIENALNNPNQ